jgi:hypothetical protein
MNPSSSATSLCIAYRLPSGSATLGTAPVSNPPLPGARPSADRELSVLRHEGIEAVVRRTARHLRETAGDEVPGAVSGLDEHELPVAPVGGILIQDRLRGRPTPSEGVEDQRTGARGNSQYLPEKPHGFGVSRGTGQQGPGPRRSRGA